MSYEGQEEQQPLKGKKSSKESSQKSGKQEQRTVVRATRDEMNLAEYPFAALSHNGPEKVIENHWDHSHPDTGRIVHATWRVAGDPKLGLPRPADECVYLVLMELTRAADMAQKVQFSRGDLLRRLGWPDNEQHYNRLKDAFTRLEMVGIVAENCFWDNRVRNYKTVGFSLIDNFEIVPENKGRKKPGTAGLSYFKWNDVIHESMMANYVKCLNLDFALSLERPLARRIYRYLDKKRYSDDLSPTKKTFEIGLELLCQVHLGMSSSPHTSQYKQRLKPAHDELLERGFLTAVDYDRMKTGPGEKVLYAFGTNWGQPIEKVKTSKRRRIPTIEEIRRACKAVYLALPEAERNGLRQEALIGVADFFYDRVEVLESPISHKLWDIVRRDHADLVELQLPRIMVDSEKPIGQAG